MDVGRGDLCGTQLGPEWLPFAPGTRWPLPDHELRLPEPAIPHELRHPDPEWELIETPPVHRVRLGHISPDNRRVVDDAGIISGLATRGVRRVLAPGPVTIESLGTVDSATLEPHDATWSSDGSVIVGAFRHADPRRGRPLVFLIGVDVASGQALWSWPAWDTWRGAVGPCVGTPLMAVELVGGRVRLFEPRSGAVRATVHVVEPGIWYSLGVNGTRLVVQSGYDQVVLRVYDVATGEVVASISPPGNGTGVRYDMHGPILSVDGRLVIMVGERVSWLLEVETGRMVFAFVGSVLAVAADLSMVVWRDNEDVVRAHQVSPDGRVLLRWSSYEIQQDTGSFARLSPDSSLLMVDAQFGVEVYRMSDGERLTAPHDRMGGRWTAAHWVDTRTLVTDGGWPAPGHSFSYFQPVKIHDSAFSPDGSMVALVAYSPKPELRLRDCGSDGDSDDRVIGRLDRWTVSDAGAFTFSADASHVFAGRRSWPLREPRAPIEFPWSRAVNTRARCAALANDGTVLAVGYGSGEVCLYRAGHDEPFARVRFRRREIRRLAFTDDGAFLAVGFVGQSDARWISVRKKRAVRRGPGPAENTLLPDWKLYLPAFARTNAAAEPLYPDRCGHLSPDGNRMFVFWSGPERPNQLLVYRRLVD